MIERNIAVLNGAYRATYNSLGELEVVNDAHTGATVWVPNHPAYTADNSLTAEFLALTKQIGAEIPLYRPDLVATDEP